MRTPVFCSCSSTCAHDCLEVGCASVAGCLNCACQAFTPGGTLKDTDLGAWTFYCDRRFGQSAEPREVEWTELGPTIIFKFLCYRCGLQHQQTDAMALERMKQVWRSSQNGRVVNGHA